MGRGGGFYRDWKLIPPPPPQSLTSTFVSVCVWVCVCVCVKVCVGVCMLDGCEGEATTRDVWVLEDINPNPVILYNPIRETYILPKRQERCSIWI